MTPPHQQQRPPQTLLGQVTQAVQTIQAKINFSQLALKPNAKVPELWVQEADAPKAEVYPLLGDRYVLGRSSKSCDIVVRNPVVSQVHLSLTREGQREKSFVLKDENSTNGIYLGRRRINSLPLRHGDVLNLGPPELAQSVSVKYHYPPPWYIQAIRYSLYGLGGVTGLFALVIGIESSKVAVRPLPDATGPVVVYSNDLEAPLRPPRSEAHIDMQRLSDFSPYLPKAVMASEDARYYWHLGVDPIGTLRAILINTKKGEVRQGGSSITQQVARSLFRKYVGTQDSLGRKVREAVVSLKLEAFYSKDRILLTYLNRVFLGSDTSGFEDASRHYFGKSARDLSLSEAATLVGILPAPNAFNPCQSYETALKRRNLVLGRMVTVGAISQNESREARRSRLEVNTKACEPSKNTKAPYLYGYVFEELRQILGDEVAREGNFLIETGVDLQMQSSAETSLRNHVSTVGSANKFSQGALVTLDSSTGLIRAMVGGTNYQQSQFNRVTGAQRQPGSTFKLFSYAAAIEQGISPGKSYSCAPLNWQGFRYRGCEHGASGSTDMFTGMALSENVIALRVAQDVGLEKVVRMAQRLGVKSPLNPIPGLVIGQSEANVLEMTGAFGAIANKGIWNPPRAIKRIYDSSDCSDRAQPKTCRLIYDATQDSQGSQQVLQRSVADTVTSLLRGVVQRGTGRSASLGLGEAGKTGTTDRNVDLWFIGFVPKNQLVTGIWLGNDNNSPTNGSSAQAAQLWGNYMRKVVQ
ncbi:FHA modulated glycosyl transferase/transpeptidase [Crinalium epipsammum PCC 9333]|uniref:FHA modulated glycosyl transferase/transpeptidase n=1 Tax=Crinalium epipsammum PCC 9333 TaxID=1173022 RepID=K9W100_9CYAN|nr:transglycosylase domain-containing protein [Crinalium epipsammum]AFZ13901.1 FHA modulated glycosyl transferase/transpeptidase [Crinalium epipsammum PCC 9333]